MPDRANKKPENPEDRQKLLDYEGGYGGARDRVEEFDEHSFGERGWSTGRATSGEQSGGSGENGPKRDLPEGVRSSEGNDARWQERFARENADKFGQSGGQPIRQRGSGQSLGGDDHREQSLGSTRDISPRGGYGIRDTEHWPEGGEREENLADNHIRDDIRERLATHSGVDASDLDVAVKDGRVTLTGTVADDNMKRLAEDLATETGGVRDVRSELRATPRA